MSVPVKMTAFLSPRWQIWLLQQLHSCLGRERKETKAKVAGGSPGSSPFSGAEYELDFGRLHFPPQELPFSFPCYLNSPDEVLSLPKPNPAVPGHWSEAVTNTKGL